MCGGRSLGGKLDAGLKPGLRVLQSKRGMEMMDLRIWKEKKQGTLQMIKGGAAGWIS